MRHHEKMSHYEKMSYHEKMSHHEKMSFQLTANIPPQTQDGMVETRLSLEVKRLNRAVGNGFVNISAG